MSVMTTEDFDDLLVELGDPESAIRKHLRSIIRAYVSSLNHATKRVSPFNWNPLAGA